MEKSNKAKTFLIYLIKPGKAISSRTLVIYLVAFFLLFHLIKPHSVKSRILNYFEVPLDYLILYSEGKEAFNKEKFIEYIDYFKVLLDYVPQLAEANGILGYCFYYLGHEKEAIQYYKEAVRLNPNFFWFYYDLGVIYFKTQDYQKAVEILQTAILLNPKDTIRLIGMSKILVNVGSRSADVNQPVNLFNFAMELDHRLKIAYEKSYELIVLSYYQLKNYAKLKEAILEFIRYDLTDKEPFYYYAGIACYYLGEYADAVLFFKESSQLNPNRADTFYYLGLTFKELKREQLSQTTLERASLLKEVDKVSATEKKDGELKLKIY